MWIYVISIKTFCLKHHLSRNVLKMGTAIYWSTVIYRNKRELGLFIGILKIFFTEGKTEIFVVI